MYDILLQVAENNSPVRFERGWSWRTMYAGKGWCKGHNVRTIYRPPNQTNESFSVFPKLLEKAWRKFSNVVLLGDFNSNLLQEGNGDISYEGNRMKRIFAQYNLYRMLLKDPQGQPPILSHWLILLWWQEKTLSNKRAHALWAFPTTTWFMQLWQWVFQETHPK